ncbi:MAG: Demethylmenaquinone methyltransferase [Deltaproteobacteria bacterium]|jgi:4-hydroxy-4-methyl-2-oxoglutarate aldolase|nr:Demethylmenaquinone methyltransferase [Deltaproteobacteria bacterium]
MAVIREIARPSVELIRALFAYDSATVHEAYGGKGALESSLKPLDPNLKVCGPVVTVSARPGDNLILHKAIYVAAEGDVLMVSAGGYVEAGPWGEIMTLAARERGIRGLIIDGSVRDSKALRELLFPVFSRGICIKGTTKETLGTINYPIQIGGVSVRPGDAVLGDADGVVVVAAQDLPAVLEKCRQRKEKEEKIRQELKQGKSTLEIYGFDKILQAKGLKES